MAHPTYIPTSTRTAARTEGRIERRLLRQYRYTAAQARLEAWSADADAELDDVLPTQRFQVSQPEIQVNYDTKVSKLK